MTSGIVVVEWLVNCKGESGISSGEAGLEGIFEGEEIGERKALTGLVRRSKPEGVKDWKSFSDETEGQSSQGGKVECRVA